MIVLVASQLLAVAGGPNPPKNSGTLGLVDSVAEVLVVVLFLDLS